MTTCLALTRTYLPVGMAARPSSSIQCWKEFDRYIQLLTELDLRLVKAVDTHLHADHVTGLAALRDRTQCITVMGEHTRADVVSMRIGDGDKIGIEGLSLGVIHTPGHTDDSYSFTMADRVFTGDTLLIRGTGRTDFQNGDARAQYDSIFNRLLKLPDATLVFPAHDYKGEMVSTIGEEKAFNPRLQVKSVNEYVELMNNLKLPNPKMMDVAVPANSKIGLSQGEVARKGWAITTADFAKAIDSQDSAIVDIRETAERDKEGVILESLHVPYATVAENLKPRGLLHELGIAKQLIFICTFGERSAMAVQLAQAVGLKSARHVHGGLAEWRAGTLNGQA